MIRVAELLAIAYGPCLERFKGVMHTHAFEVDCDGRILRTLCTVKVQHVIDSSMWAPVGTMPTCPRCLKRMERIAS